MTASVLPSIPSHSQVKVNVRLCGSIPRVALSMMQNEPTNRPQNVHSLPVFPSSLSEKINASSNGENSATRKLCSELSSIQQRDGISLQSFKQETQPQHNFFPGTTTSSLRRPPPTYEAPSWAVPARGEARLEPVCESVDLQAPVDLTSRAVFRVGRSPQSDVQLMHVTSSRRHAMLFHHSNGSCYLVDCGSAHGTYINGVRVTSTPNDSNIVVPTRIRRGSIVRFGGPGAPSFMLKSFSFDLEQMRECPVPTVNTLPATLPPTPVLSAMVEHNTRLNSLGRTAKEELMVQRQISSKRSFDSMETALESDDEMEHHHQSSDRLSSPPMSPEQHPLRLVSPELNCAAPSPTSSFKRRRVTFSDQTTSAFYPILVSPDVSSDEHEQDNECCSE
jgi:hypothetical protein